MSTISEALKKAQKQRSGIQAVAEIPVPTSLLPLAPKNPVVIPPYASGRPSFILILACVTILVLALFYYLNCKREAVLSQGDLPSPAPQVEGIAISPKPEMPFMPPERAAMGKGSTTDVVVIEPSPPKVARTDIPMLGGIFYSVKNPVAILNGSAMKEGEQVGDYRVVKIQAYSVTLNCDGEDVELRLK
jgi:hypothetical protein